MSFRPSVSTPTRRSLLLLLSTVAGCGEDGIRTLPDAPPAPDASRVDASDFDASPDAAPTLNRLYAHIAGTLVSVDPATSEVTEIGPTGQTWIVLAWDPGSQVARAVIDLYSPIGGAATPKLATLDLCTGTVTPGPAISVGATQVRRAEGLARDPGTGTFSISVGRVGTTATTEFVTETNGSVDVSTGAVTVRGTHQTLQDDGDQLFFVGSDLRLLDISTATNQGRIYSIDQTTGAATTVVDVGPTVLRVAHDPSRGVYFVTYGATNSTMRGIGTLDPTTGALTKIGAGIPDALYPGGQFTGLVSVPPLVCP